jgi:hypothetical protein
MFGLFSSPKILLLLLVVGVVWWFVRRGSIASRANDANSAAHDAKSKTRSRPGASGAEPKENARPVEDLAPCPKCGAYIAKNAGHDCTN